MTTCTAHLNCSVPHWLNEMVNLMYASLRGSGPSGAEGPSDLRATVCSRSSGANPLNCLSLQSVAWIIGDGLGVKRVCFATSLDEKQEL